MLEIDISSMSYPGAAPLIDGLRLAVPSGRVAGLIGRSGAGKTTLLRMVAGLERRYSGRISLEGRPVAGPTKVIQLLFQDQRLMPWKSVFENVAIGTSDPTGSSTREEVEECLSRVGLSYLSGAWPKHLSGGEAARVAFARALIMKPTVLLLDEPFGNLDVVTRMEVQEELLKHLADFLPTVLLVSHSAEDAVYLSDEVHVLAARPMRIAKSFPVPVGRPRSRSDLKLAALSAEILAFVSEMAGESAAVAGDCAGADRVAGQ